MYRSHIHAHLTRSLNQSQTSLCMVQFYLLPPPPSNPGDKSSPSGPGGGELFEAVLSQGVGGPGKLKITSCCSCKVRHFSVDTMAPDHVEKTAYFQGKSLEFVADWLEKNNLSTLKSVFDGMSITNC